MKKAACLILVAVMALAGQEPAKATVTKVVKLRYVEGKRVWNLLSPVAKGGLTLDGDLVVLSGPPDAVATLEDLVKQIDAPPAAKRSIEITAYMLLGVNEAAEAKTPAELSGVVKQLKETFPFAGYKLLETMFLRTSEDRGGEASGLMPGPGQVGDAVPKVVYNCRFNTARIEESAGARRVILTTLRFGTKVPYAAGKEGVSYADLGANIDTVSIREGQKAVIGRAGVGPGKESLFLVLSARIVE